MTSIINSLGSSITESFALFTEYAKVLLFLLVSVGLITFLFRRG